MPKTKNKHKNHKKSPKSATLNNNPQKSKLISKIISKPKRNFSKSFIMAFFVTKVVSVIGIVIVVLFFTNMRIISGDQYTTVVVDEKVIEFEVPPIQIDGNTLVSMREISDAFDTKISWDPKTQTTIAVHNGREMQFKINSDIAKVNRREYKMETPIYEISEKTFVPLKFVVEAIGATLEYNEGDDKILIKSPPSRDTLQNTVVSDKNRLKSTPSYYNNIAVFPEGFGMELLNIGETEAVFYAEIINEIAAELPAVKVYNVLVPTAAEFYAPKDLTPDYTNIFKKVYSNLELNVTPINTIKILDEHSDEDIYFKTDHHWTQRGAYYAYKAFIEKTGAGIPPIDTFKSENFENYKGSLINFTSGSEECDILANNPETLERRFPKAKVDGKSYDDEYCEKYIKDIEPVNVKFSTYECFIEGDFPVTVFKTDNKNGKKLAIIKESYGNAFATWAVNNYEEVYVIDFRKFNGTLGNKESFKIVDFYNAKKFNDLVVINYPVSISSDSSRQALQSLVK
ncbi:MAG: DHHW family protein [Oscillospiraceae bacterium]